MERGRDEYVQVPLRADLVEEFYEWVASRQKAVTEDTPTAQGWDEHRMRQLVKHPNTDLHMFLRYLAERSPNWVPARDAMKAAGKDMKGAGGFYARVNTSSRKRYGLPLPVEYHRQPIGDEPQQKGRQPLHYRIPEETAKLYLKVAP